MSLKFALPLAFAAACLPFGGHLHADTYTETGDVGDMLATAQQIIGTNGTALTSITGNLTLANGISDSDMYEIYISNTGTFSASNTAFSAGANNFDSQIFLFRADGLGVVGNDDAASGGSQSAIPAGSFTGTAGLYYLLISGSGRYATSGATNPGALIFPNYTDNTTDPTTTVRPTGPGGGAPLSGYTGNSNEAGKYVVALAGAQFFTPAAVPEPGAYVFMLGGAAGLAFALRARRGSAC